MRSTLALPIAYLFLLATLALPDEASAAKKKPAAKSKSPAVSLMPSQERIAAWGKMLSDTPQCVGPTIADRKTWDAAAKTPAFQKMVAAAKKMLKQPMPPLTDEVYLDFSKTGTRVNCERVMGQRSGRLHTLIVAECVENRGRFLPAIEDAIISFCGDKSWTLPAHDGKLTNFYNKEITIDLRSGAVGWQLATARQWLGDRLSKATQSRIDAELERRIFTPYESALKTGRPKLWWITGENNWNAVCLAEVTGAALANIPSRERRALFAAAAEQHIKSFLAGITPDGYCSEGLGYWCYGFGHYILLSETLRQATGGKIDLLASEKARCIAEFARRIEILPGISPAFADCSPTAKADPAIMGFLSHRYGWGMTEFEQRGIGLAAGPHGELPSLGIYGFYDDKMSTDPTKAAKPTLRDWFSDAGILIARPAAGAQHAMGVALKGGHNAENHNHNDVGSFVVAIGHSTPILDPGGETYTRRTFSAHRYDSNVLNSFGHDVPRVADCLQETGRQAAAKILKTDFTDATDTLAMDISSAYKVKSLQKLERTFVFSRAGSGQLTVTDAVEFKQPEAFGTALITFDHWKQLDANRLQIGESPDSVIVAIKAVGGPIHIKAEEIHEHLHNGKIPIRLGIDFDAPVTRASIEMIVTPLLTK